MKLFQLTYFIAACQNDNLMKASEIMYVSQPAISLAIKELENEFGVKLFNRSSNRLVLTDAGKVFYDHCLVVVNEVNELSNLMREISGNEKVIKVGAPPMIGNMMFPKLYQEMLKIYPKLKIEIVETGSLQARSMVLDNHIDIAVAILDDIVDKKLETIPLFNSQLMLCVNKKHELAQLKEVDWQLLKSQQLIMMKEDAYQNQLIKEHFKRCAIVPNILISSNQINTIKNFIKNGDGAAFLFSSIIEAEPDLVAIPFKQPIVLKIGLVLNKDEKQNINLKNFISFVQKYTTSQINEFN